MAGSRPSSPAASGTFELTTASSEETQAFGERLGKLLQAGDVLALRGDLGSGKTTLIQGLAKGLGLGPDAVKSPTFVLMREYPGPTPLIHVDGYRLEGAPAAAWLDVDWLFSPGKITVVEWAERFEGLLPPQMLQLRLSHVSANRRRITVAPSGTRAADVLERLRRPPDAS
ncbi:MAG: tRNA (adenosine(37)-N6)-threonylcarbamoyltransferase complex ATPase subunit type 1 TsaE [Candidatus Omnitrophica bacterium]|nr:tRNA (adenosine(37)-N6)-threonylcarbamoyltransferase complex ATPase subunit type 1 TsaE [Candidatus Omnitrophota bacterium]